VLVPIVIKHLEKICSDYIENRAAEDQLLRGFESVFGFLNERANKPGPQNLIAQLSDKRVWPLVMALSRSLNPSQKYRSMLLELRLNLQENFSQPMKFAWIWTCRPVSFVSPLTANWLHSKGFFLLQEFHMFLLLERLRGDHAVMPN